MTELIRADVGTAVRPSSSLIERLVLEVWTNGTIGPDEALSQAAQLVQGHMDIYTSLAEVEESPSVTVEKAEPEEEDSILDASIETLELSIRSMNCLKNANIRTLRDLVSRSEKEMVEIRNFGEKSLNSAGPMMRSAFGCPLTASG